MKYRRKPDVIVAHQWWPIGHPRHTEIKQIHHEDPEIPSTDTSDHYAWPARAWLIDPEGLWLKINPGDWVILEPSGDRYVMNNECFQRSYEKEPDPTADPIGPV